MRNVRWLDAAAFRGSQLDSVWSGNDPFADIRPHDTLYGMTTLFWRWAFRCYGSRTPSYRIGFWAICCGAIFVPLFAIAVVLAPTLANVTRLFCGVTVLAIGLANRRIRLEQRKGPNALYLKANKRGG